MPDDANLQELCASYQKEIFELRAELARLRAELAEDPGEPQGNEDAQVGSLF